MNNSITYAIISNFYIGYLQALLTQNNCSGQELLAYIATYENFKNIDSEYTRRLQEWSDDWWKRNTEKTKKNI